MLLKEDVIEKVRQLGESNIYFDEPIVGFADGDDPLFKKYKTAIGGHHLMPADFFSGNTSELTIVAWVLPIKKETIAENSKQTELPGRLWARTRQYGEEENLRMRAQMVKFFKDQNIRAVSPTHSVKFNCTMPYPHTSNWSERHAAYACGLGTFGLHDALITDAGSAHRIGSVIAELRLSPDKNSGDNIYGNCLLKASNTCGACISRCPAGAMSESGHDKTKCHQYVYIDNVHKIREKYNVKIGNCGLCMTNVPCESRNPVRKKLT